MYVEVRIYVFLLGLFLMLSDHPPVLRWSLNGSGLPQQVIFQLEITIQLAVNDLATYTCTCICSVVCTQSSKD